MLKFNKLAALYINRSLNEHIKKYIHKTWIQMPKI